MFGLLFFLQSRDFSTFREKAIISFIPQYRISPPSHSVNGMGSSTDRRFLRNGKHSHPFIYPNLYLSVEPEATATRIDDIVVITTEKTEAVLPD